MNGNKVVILCPEIVPMDNKGEEAIIRGVMDTLGFNSSNCEYHIIDPTVKTMTVKRGLYLHPSDLFFENWRLKEDGLGFSFERVYSSICAIVRHGLYRVYPRWVEWKPAVVSRLMKYIQLYKNKNENGIPQRYRNSIKHISNVDYIIAGHNGGLDENVCHVLLGLSSLKLRFTIFGSCMKPKVTQKELLNLYHKVFLKSENVIVRNPVGLKWAERYFKDVPSVLAPDPAFGMLPISDSECKKLLYELGLSDFFNKEVLLITTAEPAPISLRSFDEYTGRIAKINAHRSFFANFLKMLVEKYEFNVLFLPHTIGPTVDMDDREIAKDILQRANLKNGVTERCYVLENDLGAAELKGIISKGTMLLAERVHSIIGAIGVHTPVMCLASNTDTRVEGMLKEMAHLGSNIYYLNNPNLIECLALFSKIYDNKEIEKDRLFHMDRLFKEQLACISKTINYKNL